MTEEYFPMDLEDVYFTEVSNQIELFRYLAEVGRKKLYLEDAEDVVEAFIRREREASTGMFDGIAIPHAISDHISTARIMVAKNTKQIPWETFDGQDVSFAIAFLIPAKGEQEHLKLLSEVAQKLVDDDNRKTLLGLNRANDIYQWLKA
ncbi:PTS sugar transporter subunit IIA [Lacticaseibacillus pantheris]|nr:PTS sugar transporter subunit IIA [Lacticaseibacillus pantheris]